MKSKTAKKSEVAAKKKMRFGFRVPAWVGLAVVLVLVTGAEVLLVNSGKVGFGDLLGKEKGRVLGGSTRAEVEVDKVREEVEFWEGVIEAQPTYFDGLVRLSIYHWQLREDEKSREYLEQAREVDPGNGAIREVEEMIESG